MPTRHLRRALIVVGTIVAALLFFVGGIALRVMMGPISLGPFAGAIEDALNASVSGLVIRFDQAELEWSRDTGKVNLVVLGTRVFDLQDHIIAQAPKADVDFDAAALIAGRIEPKEFTLVGVQLTAVRKADGTLHIGFDVAETNNDMLDAILNTLNGGGPRMLDHFAIRDARLAFRDEGTGFFVVAPRAALDIAAKGAVLHAALDADLEISGKPAQLVAQADLNEDGRPRNIGVTLRHFDLSALADNSPTFTAFRMTPLTADVKANVVINDDNTIQQVVFDATGKGDLGDMSPGGISLPIEKFHLGGEYVGANSEMKIDDFTVEGLHTRGKIVGSVVLTSEDGVLRTVSGTLEGRALYFDSPALFAAPASFNGIVVSAVFDRQAKTLNISRAAITGGPLALDMSGTANFSGDGAPGLALKASVAQLPIRDLIKYWPVRAAPGARDWLDENIVSGVIGPLKLQTDIAVGALDKETLPESAVSLTFPFSGVSAIYLKGMTPITEGVGAGALTGDTFHGTVSDANIGTLPVSAGDVRIPNLHLVGALGYLHAHIEGGMPEIMALINEDPLNYPRRFGIDPTKVGGRAKVDLDFVIPMLANVSVDQLTLGVKAQTTELSLPLDERRTLTNANTNLAIDGKGLTAEGTGSISDVPVSIRWTENFQAGDAMSTHIDLGGIVDDAARKRLGLDLDWLTGTVRSQLALEGHRGKLEQGTLQADMTAATIALRAIDWTKAAGTPANLTTAVQFGDAHAMSFSNFSLTADHVQFHGALDLNGNGDLVRANFDKVVVGATDDFSAHWQVTADGAQSLQVQGKNLDASRLFVSNARKLPAGQPQPDTADFLHPLHVDAKLDKVTLRTEQALRNLLLTADFGPNERVDRFALAADGPLKGKVAAGLTATGDARRMTITADDGGALIAAFTGFNSVRGGSMLITADLGPTPPRGAPAAKAALADYKGTMELKDFTLVNQPFLARFFAIGSLDGPLRLLQGQGISFDHLTVPFSAHGKRITVADGRAAGAAIGVSFDGVVDRASDQVDLSGSLVPVYGLNSVLGNVPILGNLLVSKPGEGIFGLTYTMKGSVDEPALSVNALSALAPGILRRIFEYAPPKEPAAAANPVPQIQSAAPAPQPSATPN